MTERLTRGGIGDYDRLRNGIMSVAAQDDVDSGYAAGELQVDVHSVMRQHQHGVNSFIVAQAVDKLLQLLVADAERPVGYEALGVGNRHIRKRLANDRRSDAPPISLIVTGLKARPEAASNAGASLKAASSVRNTFCARNSPLNCARLRRSDLLAIGELQWPVITSTPKQVGRFDHVRALHGVGEAAALPQVAAVEHHVRLGARIGAQAIDQVLRWANPPMRP